MKIRYSPDIEKAIAGIKRLDAIIDAEIERQLRECDFENDVVALVNDIRHRSKNIRGEEDETN